MAPSESGTRLHPWIRDAIVFVTVLSLGAPACAINPATGRPGLVLTSKEQERRVGEKEARDIERSIGLVRDAALASYVTSIGQRLLQQSSQAEAPFQFLIPDMVEPNAFALPGGYVYVSRGLLALANSEDELANVIGHEVAHVLARHSGRRATLAAPFALVTGITSLATSIVSPMLGDAISGLGHAAGGLVLSPYSRQQERQADRLGQQLAAKAGWDPQELSTFLRTLEREEALSDASARSFDFLASHPTTPERVENTAAEAKKLVRAKIAPIAANRNDFLARLDGLLIGPNPAEGVFIGNRFLQPELGFSFQPPPGWKTRNDRHLVAALEPKKRALSVLQAAAEGDDPVAVARASAEELGFDPDRDVHARRISDIPAAHVKTSVATSEGPLTLSITWIAYGGRVYQVLGASPPEHFDAYETTFLSVARSFRPLRGDERGSIEETRLRIREARAGETLADLVQRTGATWSAEEAAVANGIDSSTGLQQGQRIKIPVRQPYGS